MIFLKPISVYVTSQWVNHQHFPVLLEIRAYHWCQSHPFFTEYYSISQVSIIQVNDASIGHTVLLRSLLLFSYFRRRMSSMGDAFVACEVVYCIDSDRIRSPHYHQLCIPYTKIGKWWNPNNQFTNQFGYNSMLANNPLTVKNNNIKIFRFTSSATNDY